METPTSVDPHAIEGHTKAHKEAFDALLERIGKGLRKQPDPMPKPEPSIGSDRHRIYPGYGWGPDR